MAGAGSSFYQDESSDVISEINVTPLVDVALVLLIIFMVTAPIIASRGITVEKPRTESGAQVKSTLTVTVDRDLTLYVNGESYDEEEKARSAIETEHAKNPEIKAIIQADRTVPHGDVMGAIDLVTQAGVTKFALASAPKQREADE